MTDSTSLGVGILRTCSEGTHVKMKYSMLSWTVYIMSVIQGDLSLAKLYRNSLQSVHDIEGINESCLDS